MYVRVKCILTRIRLYYREVKGMTFWQEYADSLAVIITLILGVVAILRTTKTEKEARQLSQKNSENMLKHYVSKAVKASKTEILGKFDTNRTQAKHEKEIEAIELADKLTKHCFDVSAIEKNFEEQMDEVKEEMGKHICESKEVADGLREERRLNLECQDIILEVLQPQGNGRIETIRGKLKKHLYVKATD